MRIRIVGSLPRVSSPSRRAALGAVAEARRRRVSAARVVALDGVTESPGIGPAAIVVNNASLGVHGDLVRRREALEHRLPKRLAVLVAGAGTLRTAAPMDLWIDGEHRRAYLVFAGNDS